MGKPLYYFAFVTALLPATMLFAQKGSLKGIVIEKKGRLAGVVITLEDLKTGTVSGVDGQFEISGIDTGRHTLKCSFAGFADFTVPVVIKDGQTADLGSLTMHDADKQLNEVKVVGAMKHGSDMKAQSMTKNANKIITVVSAESIGKMPDKNAADAMQRVAGAAVQKSKGEGNMVSLRGTPIDWTATLVNGNRLPTANENDASRIFDFQVFPSSLIDFIVVDRTVTPDMEGDNIGGAINFLTRTGVTEKTLNLDVAGGYSALARKPSLQINFTAGNITKNKKFSYVVDGSYYQRAYAADAPVVAYGTNYNHSLARLELKKYTGERYTLGLNAAAEYKPNEHFKVGVKLLEGHMTDDKWQTKTMYNWSDGSGARIRLQNIHGLLINQMYGGELNTEWKPAAANNKLKIEAKLASYYNSFHYGSFPYNGSDSRNGYTTVEYISPLLEYTDKINTNFFGEKYDPNNVKDPNPYPYKMLDIDNPYGTGGDHYTNIQPKYQQLGQPGVGVSAQDYYLSGAFSDLNDTWERDPIVAQLNGSYKINDRITITAGGKYRMKQGSRTLSYYEYRLKPGVGKIPLTDFQTMNSDPHSDYLQEWGSPYTNSFMPFLTKDQMKGFLTQYKDSLVGKPMDTSNSDYMYWLGSHYKYQENVAAGFIMADMKLGDKLSLVGGLRMEHTDLTESSDSLAVDPNGTIGVKAVDVTIHRQYIAILPALNAVYNVDNNNNIRAAVSRTFHRPNFEETKPGAPLWKREDFNIIQGNPDLKPTYSLNLDLMYEHYWGKKGMFTVGGYYKYVTDHIFETTQANENQFLGGWANKSFMNAGISFVVGFEAQIDRKFTFLPGFLSGFGINANVTCSYSEMQVPGRPKKQAMTEQAPLLYNIALYYERNKLNARIGLNYRGAYTTDVNMATNTDPAANNAPLHLDTDYDWFMGAAYSLDFQLSYKINKHLSTYIELNNLTDAPYRTYIGVPERPLRTEYYRQKGMIGFKFEL
ncbi:TonB-dependent receptor [Taibaiella soli]|nr:TonB-dependent receptor [Taibaiella soli]